MLIIIDAWGLIGETIPREARKSRPNSHKRVPLSAKFESEHPQPTTPNNFPRSHIHGYAAVATLTPPHSIAFAFAFAFAFAAMASDNSLAGLRGNVDEDISQDGIPHQGDGDLVHIYDVRRPISPLTPPDGGWPVNDPHYYPEARPAYPPLEIIAPRCTVSQLDPSTDVSFIKALHFMFISLSRQLVSPHVLQQQLSLTSSPPLQTSCMRKKLTITLLDRSSQPW